MKKSFKRKFWFALFLVGGIIADWGMKLTLKSMNVMNSMLPDYEGQLEVYKESKNKSSYSNFIKDVEKK